MKDAKGHGSEKHTAGVNRIGKPVVLYHATLEHHLDSIRANGLKPGQASNFPESTPANISLTDQKMVARAYGDTAAENYKRANGGARPGVVLLRTKMPALQSTDKWGNHNFTTGRPIPADKLEIFQNKKWSPLK